MPGRIHCNNHLAKFLTVTGLVAVLGIGRVLAAQEHQFPRSDPARLGLRPELLSRAADRADREMPALLSLAVLARDTLVFERYFHGGTDTTGFNVKSVSKSFLSALIGIAMREGFVADLDRPLATILPQYFVRPAASPHLVYRDILARMDSARRRITLRHLLTMSTGQQWEENGPVTGALLASSNLARFAAELPMEAMPGEKFNYNTAATHLLSAALAALTGTSNEDFAERFLFRPAGIVSKEWAVDAQGVAIGGSEMFFTTRGMLRFGQLYDHEGTLDGREIVPRAWVRESWSLKRTDLTDNFRAIIPGVTGYGYLWWPRAVGGVTLWCALGHGGQFIVIDHARKLVVAGTSALDARSPGTLQEMTLIWKLLDDLVFPATQP
jgi:CubicO group peptidase (beta-lactamase class C family)